MLAVILIFILVYKQMIDLTYFIQLSNNKTSFLIKVMDIFINETPKDISELEKNYTSLNHKKVKEICHKLKGLFKSYNMTELTKYAIELENISKSEQFNADSEEALKRIKELYDKHREEMIELKNKYSE